MKYICSTCFQQYDFDGKDGFEKTECVNCGTKSILRLPDICVLPENISIEEVNSLSYWKKRCELAEKVLIGRTTTFKTEDTLTYQAYQRWSEMINESNPLFNGEVSAPCSEEEKERALKFMDEIFSGLDTNKKDISDAKKAMIKNIDQMYSDKEDKQCQE